MPGTQPPTNPLPSQPQPYTVHWPLVKGGGGTNTGITVGPPSPSPDKAHGRKGVVLPVTLTLNLDAALDLSETVVLSLLYVVNGSLDYSSLFSQVEVNDNSTITFPPGQTTAQITLRTLPLPPDTTFKLEVVAYPVSVEADFTTPPGAADAEDKSLKALNALATTALVTALGALAFAPAAVTGLTDLMGPR